MDIGDLVKIKSNSGDDVGTVYGYGIYLGPLTSWKLWQQVFVFHPSPLQRLATQAKPTNFDDYWDLEVISKIKQKSD